MPESVLAYRSMTINFLDCDETVLKEGDEEGKVWENAGKEEIEKGGKEAEEKGENEFEKRRET